MVNLLIAKNGIDWTAMGFTVYGECPEYGSTKRKRNNENHESKRNISFTPAYKLWSRLLQIDRGNSKGCSGILCDEWKQFDCFEKWYNENYYAIENEKMEFSYRFFDIYNDFISPKTSCFLPIGINEIVKKLGGHYKNNGLLLNVERHNRSKLYKIRMNNNQCVAFSDSVEEINAIREILLKKQFWELSQKYKDMLPEQIYARLVNADFYRR